MPPEAIEFKDHDHKMDVWALGIILCTMLSGHIPFLSNVSTEKTARNICNQKLTFSSSSWQGVPQEAIDLLKQMLTKDPDQRFTIQ
jgi:calcium-dependent protein kinase